MILETITGILGGFVGNSITAFVNYKMKKLEIEDNKARREHDLAMVRAESEARIVEVQANLHVAQVQTEGAIQLEEARAYTESQRQGNQKVFESKWVTALLNRKDGLRFATVPLGMFICVIFGLSDAIQSLMRPSLTLYSAAIATWVTWRSWEIMESAGLTEFTTLQAITQWDQATSVAYTLGLTLVTWWFGDRRVATNMMHQAQGARG